VILNGSGFEAVAFTQPLEALRAAEVRCPDFLITDVSMPLLNGIELGIQFKAIYPECRVLLFSGAISTAPCSQALPREVLNSRSLQSKCIRPNSWKH
jgi:DNA-binding NtrC family response regulator